jgi:serine/threonine-protein kinase RsbW
MPRPKSNALAPSISLFLPSDLRFERVAVDAAGSLARQLQFAAEKIEALKTAVGEAYLNAIEHGHQRDASRKVEISFQIEGDQLRVCVRDGGPGFDPRDLAAPNLEEKLAGRSKPRGWGLFLMRELVDELSVDQPPNGGNLVTMVVKQQG